MTTKQEARQTAEGALKDAAFALLRRDGVLAGLNMQEVAERASVNRGLIHRWFGSRRALLRAAIRSHQDRLASGVHRSLERPVPDRTAWAVRQHLADPTYAHMVMLLCIDDDHADGDDGFEPIPYLDARLEHFRAEIAQGTWRADADPLALSVLWDVLLNGYVTMRGPVARQTGLTLNELDRRVFAAVGALFSSVRTVPPAATPRAGQRSRKARVR